MMVIQRLITPSPVLPSFNSISPILSHTINNFPHLTPIIENISLNTFFVNWRKIQTFFAFFNQKHTSTLRKTFAENTGMKTERSFYIAPTPVVGGFFVLFTQSCAGCLPRTK